MITSILLSVLVYSSFSFWGITSREIIWIFAQLHLNFAAFVIAIPTFALIVEFIGYWTKEEKYDNLAKDFARLVAASLSLTSILGALFLFGLIAFYPKFFSHFTSVFSPTMIFYALLFLGEFFFAYLYFYAWDKMKHRKLLHLFIGLMLNVFGISIMFIANAWTTYTMMPAGVSESGELISLWDAINNEGWWPLNIHRLVANLAFGGAIVASYAAANFISAKSDLEKGYYDWMGYIGNFIAVSALIPLPFIGYWMGYEIYQYDQQMGITMMGGVLSWGWILQGVIIGVIFLSLNYYLWVGMQRMEGAERYSKFIPVLLTVITLSLMVWFTPHTLVASLEEARKMGATYHPVLSVLGIMTAKNTAVNLLLLATYISFVIFRRCNKTPVVSWARAGNFVFWGIISVSAIFIIYLGIKGYFVDTIVRLNYSVYQVLLVLFVLVAGSIIDMMIYRKAKIAGITRWGNMPVRSQYILIVIAVSFTWLMGLMGFIRSSIRLNWHVYKILEDTSISAFVPSLGQASKMISFITILFFIMLGFVFYISNLSDKRRPVQLLTTDLN